jgi:transcriptional regulator with XRE-family HTH domain
MSASPEELQIPEWDLCDRLAKSLRTADMSVGDMAEYFDVHRNTVSGWVHGRIRVDTRTLRLWAMRTGVPYEWLRDGTAPSNGGGEPQQTVSGDGPVFLAPKPVVLSVPRPAQSERLVTAA